MWTHYEQRPMVIRIGPISTSKRELDDLLKGWLGISAAFAILMTRGLSVFGFSILAFLYSFIIAGLTVGIGFIAHELAHKLVAQRYGYFAEFVANTQMLLFAILSAFLGFIFAVPGAVMIAGPVDRLRNGKISAAGPATSLLLATFFLLFFIPFPGILGVIGRYGFLINGWLAFFNLLPIPGFDGSKIMPWNKGLYFFMVFTAIVYVFIL